MAIGNNLISFHFSISGVECFIRWLLGLDVLRTITNFEDELNHFYRPDLEGVELLL